MSGHATALAGVACLLLTLVLVFSTDLLAVFSPRSAQHAGKPIVANADPTAFQHSVQLQAALNASIYGALTPCKANKADQAAWAGPRMPIP